MDAKRTLSKKAARPGASKYVWLAVVLSLAISACGGQNERISDLESQLAELESQIEATTTTGAATTSTAAATTTTTVLMLTAAQRVYCEDITGVVAVRTPTGGTRSRPETIQFFEIAHELGYLNLPYTRDSWGLAVAETPEDFVSTTHIFYGALSLDVGEAMRQEWLLNQILEDHSLDEAFTAVCAQAWDLR
jgi:hypothetical protein